MPPEPGEARASLVAARARAGQARTRAETQLVNLLAELLDTERIYVKDLEKACELYLPLAGKPADRRSQSLDRRRRKASKHSLGTRASVDLGRRSGEVSDGLGSAGRGSAGSGSALHLDCSSAAQSLQDCSAVPSSEVRQMLGNMEDIRDYHRAVMLPGLERAQDNPSLMRQLFQGEQTRLSRKYGRYCVNNSRAGAILARHLQFFSQYQFANQLQLRVDAMLIKPIQRLTRYHMFLSALAKVCAELDCTEAAKEFGAALESVLSAASHTNTMMWIGRVESCPVELSSQGRLIKHGPVVRRQAGRTRKWGGAVRPAAAHLFLFQKSLLLCRTQENPAEPNTPHLLYEHHISINQVRVRDVVAEDEVTFELHRLEQWEVGRAGAAQHSQGGILMRIQCETEELKDCWVKAINAEVKHLRATARSLSSLSPQLFIF